MNFKLFLVIWLCTLSIVLQRMPVVQQVEEDIMAITESTISLIEEFEGKRNRMYRDSRGLPTIGVGHLIKPDEAYLLNATLTDEQVDALLRKDLQWCDETITQTIRAPINQNQYDALCSLCFNIGEEHFRSSEVVRDINKLDYMKAANAFLNWDHPAELRDRRIKERGLFLAAI